MGHFLLLATLSGCCSLVVHSAINKPVSGCVGGSLSIQCHYHLYYRDYVKYLCKGSNWFTCKPVKSTADPKREGDKVSVIDDRTQGVFTVTVRKLEKKDADWYWCAVEKAFDDLKIDFYLTVSKKTTLNHEVTTSPLNRTTTQNTTRPMFPSNRRSHVLPLVTGGLLVLLGSVLISIRKMKARAEANCRMLQNGNIDHTMGCLAPPRGDLQEDVYMDMSFQKKENKKIMPLQQGNSPCNPEDNHDVYTAMSFEKKEPSKGKTSVVHL
ncbi:CMRF35-like molecule 7 isoform X1 [Acipenser ruthenus]|uniref:CMRF35-like molecule 7 isoform X1 n=1 Tax=Acipenser ruthenus TaxID=7906 RepID=UPI00145A2AB3|nr:CMRF35-like molecule 7 isoform X1 [Acipenser ruthenus]